MKRQTITNVLVGGLVLLTPARLAWCGAKQLTLRERVALGKAATALVEATRDGRAQGTGSAFCVHETGLFVTNRHVLLTRRPRSSREDVRKITLVKDVTLVLRPGETKQEEVQARVLRVSDDLDLALLRVEGAGGKFSPLALGKVDGLVETAEVMAFGFPFGKALAVKAGSYPSISVNAGRITSMRRKAGALSQIQVDAVLNPGNSGGPVIDTRGEVIGVVVSGVLGMGVNFAIPVSHVRQFVAEPDIQFTPPPLGRANLRSPVEFRARAVSLLPSAAPLTLELALSTGKGPSRRHKMKLANGEYSVTAVPLPAPEGPRVLRLDVKYADGSVSGSVVDRAFRVGDRTVKLSNVRTLQGAPKPQALLCEGKVLNGTPSGLSQVPVRIAGQSLQLNLTSATEVSIYSPSDIDTLVCAIVALTGNKEVARLTRSVEIRGGRLTRAPSLHSWTPEQRELYTHKVWVDDDWAGKKHGDLLKGRMVGRDAFAKIQDGIDAVKAPGIVFVAAGTYRENISLRDRVYVLGSGADATIIDGSGKKDPTVVASSVGKDTILEGVTITKGSGRWLRSSYTYGGGVYITKSSLTIRNTVITKNRATDGAGGVEAYDSQIKLHNNRIIDNRGWWGGAISVHRSQVEIVGNVIEQHRCGYGGGILITDSSNASIVNNQITRSHVSAIAVMRSSTASIVNNTICTNKGKGVVLGERSRTQSVVAITNCILWGNGDDLVRCAATYSNIEDGNEGKGNLSALPLFVRESEGDYRLKPNSPCIDAGTHKGIPTNDLQRNPRPVDGDGDRVAIADMGAYEYVPAEERN
ncbi:MAG: trypsin-like peptidase domain-containing protein [Candidatus Brocadiae bacterium]|nr:trypsin-like peptidase domain-containing protein [Candidatus Brocadiia bacterium]